ncbi:GGDEF domain-containing protein [Mycolicibacterium sp.]|uniref:GGDEF domain-containing protein n=1 Tax=Mycolicibacterium sp. TaxID=2320850 RepID=UPI001A2C33FE|nr:GGDEF domain-containing protein [Mycolicibacterium sp.]MBJ7341081.1 GGDEF domain-containing protein [Mycolicibacterium sp.]
MAITAFAAGLRWRIGPWPSYAQAVAFVLWADVAVSVVAVTLSSPEARLTTMLYMGLVGVFVSFVLGWRLLLVHCGFGLVVITAITGWAVWMEGAHAFDLFAFFMPAVTWVVFVPMGGGVLISSGRRALRRTVRSAQHDPLTGLLNRRGMHVAAKNTLGRVPTPTTLVAAVCDIDGFKKINDERGHAAGDLILVAVARTLESVARRGDIAARIGGDEMVLLAFVDDPAEASAVVDRLRPLTQIEVDGVELNVSIGSQPTALTRRTS